MSLTQISREVISKYDVTGPRYTSYPTAPEWSTDVTHRTYANKLKTIQKADKPISVYIHIPFCEDLCYFCACNKIVRKRLDKYGDKYLDSVGHEISLAGGLLGPKKKVVQYHWGGGTPTYLTERQIKDLFCATQEYFDIDPEGEIAIEIDPRTVSKEKLKTLKDLGFNRISMGVQDFNLEVQKAVNRIQPYEKVKEVYDICRGLGFISVNFDLVYGLPYQTQKTFLDTAKKVIYLRPDRIALYSYANVPWLIPHQQRINDTSLPGADEKIGIFIGARQMFIESGYEAIAMDHFALAGDELARAAAQGTLYRNFMGYTVKPTDDFIGFGMSSISYLDDAFFQNYKDLERYDGALLGGLLPIERGHVLTEDDKKRQWVIRSLMCRFCIDKKDFMQRFGCDFDDYFSEEKEHLQRCRDDGIVTCKPDKIVVTDTGKLFVRNVCMGFDRYLKQKKGQREFSKTI